MTKVMESSRAYNELEVVNVRLVKEPSIISEKPIGSPGDAVEFISPHCEGVSLLQRV